MSRKGWGFAPWQSVQIAPTSPHAVKISRFTNLDSLLLGPSIPLESWKIKKGLSTRQSGQIEIRGLPYDIREFSDIIILTRLTQKTTTPLVPNSRKSREKIGSQLNAPEVILCPPWCQLGGPASCAPGLPPLFYLLRRPQLDSV